MVDQETISGTYSSSRKKIIKKKKSESNPHVLKQNFYEMQSYYSDYQHIYTDGSKDEEKNWLCSFDAERLLNDVVLQYSR